MKLGEALAQLKKEKSRLARLISLRKDNIYVEKGKKTPFDPSKLGKDIEDKIEEIRKLKVDVQRTNLNTLFENNISLAEAIIKVNDIRSKIAGLSGLFNEKREYSFRLRGKDDIEKVPQLDESKIEEEMENLEAEKTKIDNLIQVINWKTELMTI
jgi:hypothetical protein